MSKREKVFLGAGAAGLIILVAVGGGLVYALLTASTVTLRWWAGIVTLALPAAVLLAYFLGKQAARERIAGLEQGINAVTEAARRTVDTARQTVAVRAEAAAIRRSVQPAIQQVFLPGLPAGGQVILPASQGGEVEL